MKSLRTLLFSFGICQLWARLLALHSGPDGSRRLLLIVMCVFASLTCHGCEGRRTSKARVAGTVGEQRGGPCQREVGHVEDAVTRELFPSRVGAVCLDPHADTRVFADDQPLSLSDACTQLVLGDCSSLLAQGLTRVVGHNYLSGEAGSVNAVLLQFEDTDGAVAFLTDRTLGAVDPVELEVTALTVGAMGGQMGQVARFVQGRHVVELIYANPRENLQRSLASARQVLPELAAAFAKRLGTRGALPAAVQSLPGEWRLPFGVKYQLDDALGVHGAGAAATGFYRNGRKRWRVLSVVREDADAARDVDRTLQRVVGYHKSKNSPYGSFQLRFALEGGLTEEWVLARLGNRLWGVGDEARLLTPNLTEPERQEICLTRDEKLEQLRRLLVSRP